MHITIWRYLWKENDSLFQYVHEPLLDCKCMSELLDNTVYSFDNVEFLSQRISEYHYKFHKIKNDIKNNIKNVDVNK